MINLFHFSPCGTTKLSALTLIEGMNEEVNEIELLNPSTKKVDAHGLNVVAFPVYSGYVPPVVFDRLDAVLPKTGQVVGIAVYGNRSCDNALAEAEEYLCARGLEVVALVSTIAEHALCRKIASGRPDSSDKEALHAFGKQISQKIENGGGGKFDFPKKPDMKPYALGISPITTDDCIACGICADECPTQEIEIEDVAVSSEHCLGCTRCIDVCPQGARVFPDEAAAMFEQFLTKVASERREPELFL